MIEAREDITDDDRKKFFFSGQALIVKSPHYKKPCRKNMKRKTVLSTFNVHWGSDEMNSFGDAGKNILANLMMKAKKHVARKKTLEPEKALGSKITPEARE